jgi:uncharacterized oxidoreductase
LILNELGLRQLAAAILEHSGSSVEEAEVVADHLVRANLAGHDSHGVGMIPYYMRFLADGSLQPNAPARLVRDDGPVLMFDGGRGYGQRIARETMAAAIARCRKTGVALLTLRNSHHIGRVGTYGEQSIEAGLVSIHFVNVQDHPPLVAPFRGSDARFGTNPICIAVPGTRESPPTLLDMATSKIALGKVRVHMNKGEEAPDGCLIDHRGRPTRDPNVMFRDRERGALLPIGDHKGYGLVLACELLAGVLSGGGTMQPGIPRRGAILNNMLAILIDPGRMVPSEWVQQEVDAILAYAKSSPPANPDEPVLVAGDPERAEAERRRTQGIEVDATTWEELMGAGETLGLDRTRARQLAGVA